MAAGQAVLLVFLLTSRGQFTQSSREGAGTFVSKVLVSSGNTFSSAIGALSLVFPVPYEDRKGLNLRLRRRGRR